MSRKRRERRGKGKCLDFRDADKVEGTARERKKRTIRSTDVEQGLTTGGLSVTTWRKEMAHGMEQTP